MLSHIAAKYSIRTIMVKKDTFYTSSKDNPQTMEKHTRDIANLQMEKLKRHFVIEIKMFIGVEEKDLYNRTHKRIYLCFNALNFFKTNANTLCTTSKILHENE